MPLSSNPPVVFLMGPTATGKTDLAMQLAAQFPLEIVSVDSALVYRGMDIGTAKPSAQLRARVPHHLIDICDPADAYSAGRFRSDALRVIAEIHARGRMPLLVGGTLLYFRALQQGLSQLPTANEEVRAHIEARAQEQGWAALHAELARVDPAAAQRIHPNDPQRIQRALEVYELTGRALSDFYPETPAVLPFRITKIALIPQDRAELHRRITQRFAHMVSAGIVQEVETLRARGDLHPDLSSMRAVGYRQIWEYLNGAGDLPTQIERAVIATRQLARRQLTWLRAETDAVVIDPFTASAEAAVVALLRGI